MVNNLQDSPTIANAAGMQLLCQLISDGLGQSLTVRSQFAVRTQLIEIVLACARFSDGLHILVEAVDFLENGTTLTDVVHLLVDEWDAVEAVDPDDWATFRDALRGLALSELGELFALATSFRIPRPPARCRTAWQVFVYLAGMNAGPDAPPPSMIFLDFLTDRMAPEAGQAIRLRNRRRASELGLTPALNAARGPHLPGVRQRSSPAYLMIQLEPDSIDDKLYTLSHWQQLDPGSWQPARGEDRLVRQRDLEAEVERVIAEAEAGWAHGPETVILEFILPLELINAPVEWWNVESGSDRPSPLAISYPVVVRSLERLRTHRWHRMWNARWRRMTDQPEMIEHFRSEPAGDDYATRLEMLLKANEQYVALILGVPPDVANGGHAEIEAALRSGIPVIVWHRVDRADDSFVEIVSTRLLPEVLADLPRSARELRQAAFQDSTESRSSRIGRHLTVLWDDPERQPEVPRLSGVSEEGSDGYESGAG